MATSVDGFNRPRSNGAHHDSLNSIDFQNSSMWILRTHKYGLVNKIYPWWSSGEEPEETSFKINLAQIQRTRLRQLQMKLIKHVRKLYQEEDPGRDLDSDLRDYVQCLQDHDYMTQCRSRPIDPFIISGTRYIDRHMLNSAFRDIGEAEKGNMKKNAELRWDDHATSIVGSRTKISSARLLNHLVVAAVGAGFLIGPMWLMMLNHGLYTALISTTVFVAVFGALMAVVLEKHMDILSSTAAYAAVLVVFVGLTSAS
ncbi:hypothetical protein F5B19DRAFT_254602 [Rostrohypoxylon terebratum]|nr:hypothetical protein F5B19DRAFT_254602 [Rostrohypoxylon terebratum]